MADSASADPFAMWRDWVAQSERQWNAFLNDAMATDEFTQSMSRFLDVYLNIQKNMNDVMSRYFSVLNVPTRTDVLSLGDRLSGIEDRLGAIEHAIASLKPAADASAARSGASPAPRPPRTKKPASAKA
jgi:polyhydroxyalkanoic acid synthase PhaR subunit